MNKDLQNLGKDAAQVANRNLIEPISSMAHDVQQALQENVQRGREVIADKISSGRKAIASNVAQTQESMEHLRDQTSVWIASNPFTSIGLAFIAGIVLTSLSRSHDD